MNRFSRRRAWGVLARNHYRLEEIALVWATGHVAKIHPKIVEARRTSAYHGFSLGKVGDHVFDLGFIAADSRFRAKIFPEKSTSSDTNQIQLFLAFFAYLKCGQAR